MGVLGPILTLVALAWAWHWLTARRAKVRVAEPEPRLAALDAAGQPIFPVNLPYCAEHRLVFAPSGVLLKFDGADL